jgi:hypothetical protein
MAGQTTSKIQYAISPESTAGTYLAPVSGEYLPHGAGSFNDTKEMVFLEASTGGLSTTQERKISKLMAAGNIPTPLGKKSAGNILAAIFGQFDASPTGSNPYTHDYTVLDSNSHKTFSIVRIDDLGSQRHFPYGTLNTASMEVSMNGDPIFVKTDWVSQASASQSDVTPAYDTGELFFYPDNLTVEIQDEGDAYTGTANLTLEGFTLNVDKGADPRGALGTTGLSTILTTNFAVTGSITNLKQNDTAFNEALTDQVKAMQVTIGDGTHSITFDMDSLTFDAPELSTDLNGAEIMTRDFTVHKADSTFSASLVNDVAAYPLT